MCHSDVYHRFGDVETLLIIANEAPPPGHPAEGGFDDPASGQHVEAGFRIGPAHDLEHEILLGCGIHQARSIIGAVSEECLSQGQRLRMLDMIFWAPALSEMSGAVRFTIGSRLSVSTAMWRWRPTIFLAAPNPRFSASGCLHRLAVHDRRRAALLPRLMLTVEHQRHVMDGLEQQPVP